MPPEQLLSALEISEAFITGLNSKFEDLQARMEIEQLEKLRIIARNPLEPTPYLDHTGYPPTIEDAYQKARDHEEARGNFKGKTSHLSRFNTVAEPRMEGGVKYFTNTKTGERKTLKEMTLRDSSHDYNLAPCNRCQPKYPGRHFNLSLSSLSLSSLS